MKKYRIQGSFEGEIEADSPEDAEMNFHESDIDTLEILAIWQDDEG